MERDVFVFIATDYGFDLRLNDQTYNVHEEHEHFDELKEAAQEGDKERFLDLYDNSQKVEEYFEDTDVEYEEGILTYQGRKIDNSLADKILDMIRQGQNPTHFVKFLDNLMENPSRRSVTQLYDFLEYMDIPLTDRGTFLAYKSVTSDLKDVYGSGRPDDERFDNSPSSVCEMPRNQISDDPRQGCDKGLHVGAWDYAGFDGYYNTSSRRVVLVEVNPKDVVSVPYEHSHQKVRTCKYKVLREIEEGEGPIEDSFVKLDEAESFMKFYRKIADTDESGDENTEDTTENKQKQDEEKESDTGKKDNSKPPRCERGHFVKSGIDVCPHCGSDVPQ